MINQTTVKRLHGWSHYQFHQRLEQSAQLRGVVVHRTEEFGTSKTCGRCGNWKADLAGALTYDCDRLTCGLAIDRDVNGARNNLLCALTLHLGRSLPTHHH